MGRHTSWARVIVGALIVAQAPTVLPVGVFTIQPGDNRVEFVMRDNRGGFTGTTDKVDGTVTVRRGDSDAVEAAIEARVDARTLTTGNGTRDGQMRRDFLQTDRHPFITFRGTATARDAGRVAERARLRGTLTIRDVTREIEMPLDVSATADEYRASGEVTVRLSEYGIPIPRFLIFRAEDPMTIRLRVRLRRS